MCDGVQLVARWCVGAYRSGMKYVGVDGCKGGWFVVWGDDGRWDFEVYVDFSALWQAHCDAGCILVDIPIGLARDSVRQADVQTRNLLGPRKSSIFNTPVREAVHALSKEAAKSINRQAVGKSLSEQSLGIMTKIKEVDLFLTVHPEAVEKVFESHPELCFAKAAGQPMRYAKKDVAGVLERYELLKRFVPDVRGFVERVRNSCPAGVMAGDDVFDALILAVIGGQGRGKLKSIPEPPEFDEKGLPMAIWYAEF